MVQDVTLGAHEAHVGAAPPASLGSRQLHARLAEQRAASFLLMQLHYGA